MAGAPSRPTLSAAGQGAPRKTGRSLHLEAVALSSKGGTKADTVTAVSQELARKDQGGQFCSSGLSHVSGAHTAKASPRRPDQEATGGRGLAPSGSRGPRTSRCGNNRSWTERHDPLWPLCLLPHPCSRTDGAAASSSR